MVNLYIIYLPRNFIYSLQLRERKYNSLKFIFSSLFQILYTIQSSFLKLNQKFLITVGLDTGKIIKVLPLLPPLLCKGLSTNDVAAINNQRVSKRWNFGIHPMPSNPTWVGMPHPPSGVGRGLLDPPPVTCHVDISGPIRLIYVV